MKQCNIILKGRNTGGVITLLPNRTEDAEAHRDFVAGIACGLNGGLTADKAVYVRAVYTVVSAEYVRFAIMRMHYFAYFGTVVSDGLQRWTDTIAGKTKDEKVETLHISSKKFWASLHSGEMLSLADAKNKTQEAMSRSIEYCDWAMRQVYDAHILATQGERSGAWAPQPWKDME